VIGYTTVSSSAAAIRPSAARNLPAITSPSRTGIVVSSSIVPVFRSSAIKRIVIAGARITRSIDGEKIEGAKNARMSARAIKKQRAEVHPAGDEQERDEHDVRHRRVEVAAQLLLRYREDLTHVCPLRPR
jgi:hypothetical protein